MRDGVLVSEVRVRGPLDGYAVGFAEFLAALGYAPGSVRLQMHSGRSAEPVAWMREGLSGCRPDGVHGGAVCRCSAGAGGAIVSLSAGA